MLMESWWYNDENEVDVMLIWRCMYFYELMWLYVQLEKLKKIKTILLFKYVCLFYNHHLHTNVTLYFPSKYVFLLPLFFKFF